MDSHQVMRGLILAARLRDVDDAQMCIDSLRYMDRFDQAVQLDLDRQQTELSERRKYLVRALNRIFCPN